MRGENIMKLSGEERINRIKNIQDKDIDYSDIPELDDDFWEHAEVKEPEPKKSVTLRLDTDVLNWLKSQGKGYQTKINAILRSYYEAHKEQAS